MGVMKKFSSSSYDRPVETRVVYQEVNNNPNPKKYSIKRSRRYGKKSGLGNYLVLEINYPDCTNYEGNKILVFEDTTLIELARQGSIDPHFSQNSKYKSPIARFRPTQEGWDNAKMFVILLGNLR